MSDQNDRLDALTQEVQKLRVLGEENTTQLRLIAEVQSHHGDVLSQHGAALHRLEVAIEPLKVVPEVLQKVLGDHEGRITALEKRQ
jgi:hypothetical protein